MMTTHILDVLSTTFTLTAAFVGFASAWVHYRTAKLAYRATREPGDAREDD